MQPRKLNDCVTIEQKTVVRDPEYGSETIAWQPFAARIAAEVQDVLPSRSERVVQGMRVATRPARIRIRSRPGVTSDMRVVIHGASDRLCQIIGGPAEIDRGRGLELVVEEYSA